MERKSSDSDVHGERVRDVRGVDKAGAWSVERGTLSRYSVCVVFYCLRPLAGCGVSCFLCVWYTQVPGGTALINFPETRRGKEFTRSLVLSHLHGPWVLSSRHRDRKYRVSRTQ